MKPSSPVFSSVSVVMGFLAGLQMASGALLVNETYDAYNPVTLSNTGTTAITGPTTNATGLTGDYIVNNPGGGSGYVFSSGGLAFADYNTAGGGKISFRSNTGGTTLAARLSLSSSVTGTLYASYLVNVNVAGTLPSSSTEVRIVSNSGDTGGSSRFRSQVDSTIADQNGPGASYSGNTGATGSGTALTIDTTYMVISRFTSVGQALSPSTPGTATTFVLDASQYLAFKATGFSESYLDSGAVTARVASTAIESGSALPFANGNFIQIGGIGTSSGVTHFDALKYGTDLLSVVTVPEPSNAALVLIGSTLGLVRRRKR